MVAHTGAIAQPVPVDQVVKASAGGGADAILASRGPLRVLIIDDNHDAADSFSKLVKIWGHDPEVAYGRADTLASTSHQLPDVVFTDIGMPTLNGFQLALRLRGLARYADTLLVAVTGWGDAPHRRLWAAAFDHFLVKPVDLPESEKLLRDRDRLARSRTGGDVASAAIWPGVPIGAGPSLCRGSASPSPTTPNYFFGGT